MSPNPGPASSARPPTACPRGRRPGRLVAGVLTACGGGSGSGGSASIVVTHGYTDVEATAMKARGRHVEPAAPRREGQPAVQRWQRQRAAEDGRRLHRRQLPRRRLPVRLLGQPAGQAAQAGRPHRPGQGSLGGLERLLPLGPRGVHGRRQGGRRPGPDRQPQPGLQQGPLRQGRTWPRPPTTGPGRTSATRPRS